MLYGCAPGGGMSNIIIYWVGGDLDLSITMTMVSCILALAFSPLWLLAVPTLLPVEGEIDIPFADIAINIATVVLPA
jgi:sodium/bile acid cotransporter 2